MKPCNFQAHNETVCNTLQMDAVIHKTLCVFRCLSTCVSSSKPQVIAITMVTRWPMLAISESLTGSVPASVHGCTAYVKYSPIESLCLPSQQPLPLLYSETFSSSALCGSAQTKHTFHDEAARHSTSVLCAFNAGEHEKGNTKQCWRETRDAAFNFKLVGIKFVGFCAFICYSRQRQKKQKKQNKTSCCAFMNLAAWQWLYHSNMICLLKYQTKGRINVAPMVQLAHLVRRHFHRHKHRLPDSLFWCRNSICSFCPARWARR